MRKCLTSISLVGASGLAACFGSGPAPQQSQAKIVLVAPTGNNVCTDSRYISSVAIGSALGYAVFEPYLPPNTDTCNNGSNSGPPNVGVEVLSWDKDGATPQGVNVGPAGMSNTYNPPPLATSLTGDVYAMNGTQAYQGQVQSNVQFSGGGGGFSPVSLVAGASRLFMIVYNQMGGELPDLANPQWPCCGGSFGGASGQFASIPVPIVAGTQIPVTMITTVTPYCDELKQCLVGNPGELYYMRHDSGGSAFAAIDRYSKLDDSITTFNYLPNTLSSSAIPVGLAATPTHVAWAIANSGQNLVNAQIQPGCWIYGQSLADPPLSGGLLFQSGKFSCLDVAIDDTYAYFTIVRSNSGDGCNGGCIEPVKGYGIGRVLLDGTGGFESLSMAMGGLFAGPRRVFVDGDSLYVADPTVMAKIPTSALENAHDIPQ